MNTDDWTTVTARKQRPTRAIVTPMVNRYQGLDDDNTTSALTQTLKSYIEPAT